MRRIPNEKNIAVLMPVRSDLDTDALNPPLRLLTPAKTSNATYRETLMLAMEIEIMKLPSIPMFDIVLRNPEESPYNSLGELPITALLFAGKNIEVPIPVKNDPIRMIFNDAETVRVE